MEAFCRAADRPPHVTLETRQRAGCSGGRGSAIAAAMLSVALSIVMLAVFALIAGAVWLWRKPGMRKQAVLMLVLAAIAALNVAIWTVPDGEGRSPASRVGESR